MDQIKQETEAIMRELGGLKKKIYFLELDEVKRELALEYEKIPQRLKAVGVDDELIVELVKEIKKATEREFTGLEVLHCGRAVAMIWHGRPGPYDTGGDVYW